jgi:hypothetical protein
MIVLRDLVHRNRVFNSSYTVGDSYETAFYEGRRRAVLEILNMLVNEKSKVGFEKVVAFMENDNMEELLHDD